MLKKLPVVVRFSDSEVKKYDLMKELKVDRMNLDEQLARQPRLYAKWSELYATASARVAKLKETLEKLEAQLHIQYIEEGYKYTEAKHKVLLNKKYQLYQIRLRRWTSAEKHLQYASKSFEQRLTAMICLNANVRKEKNGYGD